MPAIRSESQAMRREWAAGLAGFFLSFGAVAAACAYVLLVHFLPQKGWLDTLFAGAQLLLLAIVAGLGGAWVPMRFVQRRHYSRGVYRCHRCNRALRGIGAYCVCWPKEDCHEPRPRRPMRHYRRRVMPVLLTYVVLLGLTLLIARVAHPPNMTPARVAFGHALLCVLLAVGIELSHGVLELLKRGRRFRLRSVIFQRVLIIWPAIFGIAGLIAHAMGVDPLKL